MKNLSLSTHARSHSLLHSNVKYADIWNETLKENFDKLWSQSSTGATASTSGGTTYSASLSSASQSFSFGSTNISVVPSKGISTPRTSCPGDSDGSDNDDDDGGGDGGDGGGGNSDGDSDGGLRTALQP
ncbi:hypothetical protein BGZ76_007639 [Entomortierella beljakovae]|nr:hypothetical protein BGZ76_007639 [Entomortierella beljakovae]